MKTFKQFLAEEAQSPFQKYMEEHCGDFLDQSGRKDFLIRGMKKIDPSEWDTLKSSNVDGLPHYIPYHTLLMRTNRQPSDTSLATHEVINEWFRERFGWGARSEVVFGEGRYNIAASSSSIDYGPTFIIFPVGDFKYVWSEDVSDLYRTLGAKMLDKPTMTDERKENIWKFLDSAEYRSTGLREALATYNSEIMIHCREYIAIPAAHAAVVRSELMA